MSTDVLCKNKYVITTLKAVANWYKIQVQYVSISYFVMILITVHVLMTRELKTVSKKLTAVSGLAFLRMRIVNITMLCYAS